MKSRDVLRPSILFIFLGLPGLSSGAPIDNEALKEGATVSIDGQKATLKKLVDLPYVESKYTKLFRFDSYDNPKLKQLRDRYKLDDVTAPGKDEFEKQILLMYWVNDQFKKFGRPTSESRGALDVLSDVENGHTFYCTHYCDVLISSSASLGWIDRPIGLKRPDNLGEGFWEHSVTEIWSNQYRKWVMLDPLFALYVERDGVPLNAYELRQEWFYKEGKNLDLVVGKDRKKYKRSDLPLFRGHFAGFGNLMLNESAFHLYAFIEYIPNANLLDVHADLEKSIIFKDRLCEGTPWHTRLGPENPATDVYFPIDQVALSLTADGSHLRAGFQTLTPNFKTFMLRIDDGDWKPAGDALAWDLHPSSNRLQVKSVNKFGVEGPASSAEVEVSGE